MTLVLVLGSVTNELAVVAELIFMGVNAISSIVVNGDDGGI